MVFDLDGLDPPISEYIFEANLNKNSYCDFTCFVLRYWYFCFLCFIFLLHLKLTSFLFLRSFYTVQSFNKVCLKKKKKNVPRMLTFWRTETDGRCADRQSGPDTSGSESLENVLRTGCVPSVWKSLTFLPGITLQCVSPFVISPSYVNGARSWREWD